MKNFWRKFKIMLYDGFLFVIIYEILEEILEDLIALAITDVFFGILSRVFCITVAQVIKFFIKKTIKTLTRREGDDKMKLLKKICYVLYFNKCTIAMTLLSAFSAFSAYIILPLAMWLKIVIASVILCVGVLCAIQIGWETYEEIKERLSLKRDKKLKKKEKKNEKKLEKNKKKALKREEKEIRKIAQKMEKDRIAKMKLEAKSREADLKLSILEDAKKEYENQIKEKENKIIEEQPKAEN